MLIFQNFRVAGPSGARFGVGKINKKKQAKIYQKKLVYNKNNKTVLVKTIYSGISKGTEKLVSSKSVSKDQFELMKAPFQEGSFNLPIKYGYINVGNIVDGPRKYINKKIILVVVRL